MIAEAALPSLSRVGASARPRRSAYVGGGAALRRLPAGLRASDPLLVAALCLWAVGIRSTDTGVLTGPWGTRQLGLLSGLPVAYFAGFAVLLASGGSLLAARRLSGPRLALHVAALVLMLHGTAPLIYPTARYSWTYKHIGVTQYIAVHGSLGSRVDIYQSWPGLFALAAWFDKVAGVSSPLAFAAWSQLFFNLVACLEIGFAIRALPLTERERWLALLLFVVGNWVDQDYFAPQAVAFVMSMGVMAIALHWLQDDRPPAWLPGAARRGAEKLRWSGDRDPGVFDAGPRSRAVALGALVVVYTALVAAHQLSPYVVVIQLGVLTLAGRLRPRWAVLLLLAIALGYLAPRFTVVNNTFGLLDAINHPFRNIFNSTSRLPPGLEGRQFSADAARALSAGIGALALFGIWRGRRAGRPIASMVLLAVSPVVVILLSTYGGEALYRTYLFSLPWMACLGAVALSPQAALRASPRAVIPAAALILGAALIIPAYFGLDESTVIPPAEVTASRYFYAHARPGSALVGSPNFPFRLGSNYNRFIIGRSDSDPSFLNDRHLWHRMLGSKDLLVLASILHHYAPPGSGRSAYLVLSTGQSNYATMYGILPPGSMESLESALLLSPDWSVFYRNSDTIIFQLGLPLAGGSGPAFG
ncbi:MAG: hypothetical protein ACREPI_05085 [Candidatus Dormibacterales bacterium]